MIAPEPTEVEHHERWRAPWDYGVDPDRIVSCMITVADGMGVAGHLGVIEEQCPAHHLLWLEHFGSCPTCGGAVVNIPP